MNLIVLFPGGPLLLQGYPALLGVNKAYRKHKTPVDGISKTQIFTKVSYFFGWISHITNLRLPECAEQAPIFP